MPHAWVIMALPATSDFPDQWGHIDGRGSGLPVGMAADPGEPTPQIISSQQKAVHGVGSRQLDHRTGRARLGDHQPKQGHRRRRECLVDNVGEQLIQPPPDADAMLDRGVGQAVHDLSQLAAVLGEPVPSRVITEVGLVSTSGAGELLVRFVVAQ